MKTVQFTPRQQAPVWSSLVALSLGSASSVRVRSSVHSFSGTVAVFTFHSIASASAFSGRCSSVVGIYCAVRESISRSGNTVWCVSVPCLWSSLAPSSWSRPASLLASLRHRSLKGGVL